MAQFNVTELDFDKIKDSIKSYLRAQPKYTDWDFDGAGLNVLLDILAYNTHYNAMVAHFSLNETFLDSAQIRGNVVSHAKLLGYVPRSTLASAVRLGVTITASSGYTSSTLDIPRGTRFMTTYDGIQYNFVVVTGVTAIRNSNTFTFNTDNDNPVFAKQGTLKRILFRVNTGVANQRFEIPDVDVDTTTLRVRVKDNESSDSYTTFTQFSTMSGVTSTTPIYFLQENASGKYDVYFGDGVIGKSLASNNIVELEYVYTNGDIANGASVFEIVDSITGAGTVSIVTEESAYGGTPRETIESIRYNAPLTYVAQNRAVTVDDYKAIIMREFGAIDSISVWGGENSVTPDFGKVFISIKPTGKELLNDTEKNYILNTVLAGKNVVSVKPEIVDPEYTYIDLDVFFKYNPNLTDHTRVELESFVRTTIETYAEENLRKFDGVFRYSQFLKAIDSRDPSILNSDARVFMTKYITPVSGVTYYELLYASPIYQTTSTESVISTNTFKIGGIDHELRDAVKTGSTDRTIYLYKNVQGVLTRVRSIGTVYAADGLVVIDGLNPDTTAPIMVTVLPNSNDLAPKRNQLLDIESVNTTITGEIDTIVVGGSAGAIGYTTPSRHR